MRACMSLCVCARARLCLCVSVCVRVRLFERNYRLVAAQSVLHNTFEITFQATASLQTTPSMP